MQSRNRDIDIIEDLEAIRRRPTIFIGEQTPERSLCSRLVECVVRGVATMKPAPTAARLLVWTGRAVTVAYDGEPLPIRPCENGGLAHPELYSLFMYLFAPDTPLQLGAAVVNALSERLVVSTVHDGVRYRAVFRHGGLVSLLTRTPAEETFGASWLTFEPASDLAAGHVDVAEAERIAASVRATTGVSITAIDRSSEKPDWW